MRRAVAASFAGLRGGPVRVIVTLDARLPDDPGPWTVVRIAVGSYDDRLRELAQEADFTVLIAPETNGILAALTRDLELAGAHVLGSSSGAVLVAGDKSQLAARLEAQAIATPPTRVVVPSAGLPRNSEYPAVLKPLDGAGSVDTYYLADARSLPIEARTMPMALLQPFVPGKPMSASFLVGHRGSSWLIGMGVQHMAIRAGRFEYKGGTLPIGCPGAAAQAQAALGAVAGLRGFVGVDFIWDEAREHATILEINPRPTTSCVGLVKLLSPGMLAEAWLAACVPVAADPTILAGLADRVSAGRRLSFGADGSL
jgi:predicted ATP-grasp superfamily ATP-dependent carboligase